jgi:hypothetical protein
MATTLPTSAPRNQKLKGSPDPAIQNGPDPTLILEPLSTYRYTLGVQLNQNKMSSPTLYHFKNVFQGKFLMIRSEKVRIRFQYVDQTFPMNFGHKATILVFSESFLSFIHSHFQTLSCRSYSPPFRYLHNHGSVETDLHGVPDKEIPRINHLPTPHPPLSSAAP